MKKLKTLSLFALATIFASCSSDNIVGDNTVTPSEPDGETTNLTFTGDIEGSKTFMEGNKIYWLQSDALGFFAIQGETFPASASSAAAQFRAGFSKYSNPSSKLKADFNAPNTVLPGSGKYNYCIAYPYTSGATWVAGTAKSKGYKVSGTQSQSVKNNNDDVLSANGYAVTRIDGKWRTDHNIALGQLTSQVSYVEINLSALNTNYSGKKVSSVVFEAFKNTDESGSSNPTIAGDFSIDWSKYNVTTGMRAVADITNGTNKITLTTTPANFVVDNNIMAYMTILPMSETMDHYKVTVYMDDGTNYQAKGGSNLQLGAGKKYRITLPAEPNMTPATLEYDEIYLYWGNDDMDGDGYVDAHSSNYDFNLGSIKPTFGTIWIKASDGVKFSNSSLPVGSSWVTSGKVIKVGSQIDSLKIQLLSQYRSLGDIPIQIYLTDPVANSSATPSQTWNLHWNNRLGYNQQQIAGGTFSNSSNVKNTALITSVSGAVGVSANPASATISSTMTDKTPLSTREGSFTTTLNDGKKAKVYVQQNQLAISTNPIRISYSDGEYKYVLNNTDPIVFMLPGFAVGIHIGTSVSSYPTKWNDTDRIYYTPSWGSNGKPHIEKHTSGPALGSISQLTDIPSVYYPTHPYNDDPCAYIQPAYTWRVPNATEQTEMKTNRTLIGGNPRIIRFQLNGANVDFPSYPHVGHVSEYSNTYDTTIGISTIGINYLNTTERELGYIFCAVACVRN